MVAVTFEYDDGRHIQADLPEGMSLMEGALRQGIDGIDAECGGALSCATCHVHFSRDWFEKLPPPSPEETDMLEFAVEPTDTSRLSCQIMVKAELDGLPVRIPKSQH